MAQYVEGTLQATGGVREQVGVICDTDSGGVERTKIESQFGGVQADETRVYVNLEVATGPYMSLPIAFAFFDSSA